MLLEASFGRPPFDHELVGLVVEAGDGDFRDVGDEHLPVGRVGRFLGGDRARGDGAARDLRLTRPLALLAFDGMKRRPVQRNARIPRDVGALARPVHRTEAEFAVFELTLDAGNAR